MVPEVDGRQQRMTSEGELKKQLLRPFKNTGSQILDSIAPLIEVVLDEAKVDLFGCESCGVKDSCLEYHLQAVLPRLRV